MKKIIGLLVVIGLCFGMIGCGEGIGTTYVQNETSQEVTILGTNFSCKGIVMTKGYSGMGIIYNLKCDNGQMVYNIQNFMVK